MSYARVPLARWSLGRLLFPLPSPALFRLLFSSEPLHAHLPCPAVLLIALTARILRPRRFISLHWHSFLEPSSTPSGRLFGIYQSFTESLLPLFARIITTSPILGEALLAAGAAKSAVRVLPCSLPAEVEVQALRYARLRFLQPEHRSFIRLICIGRLDSYKRVDWLIDVVSQLPDLPLVLDVVGDGPDLHALTLQAARIAPGQVNFHGRVSEEYKWSLLEQADLLVLPANVSNEAFGIVQLEAMAFGVPAIAFEYSRSGTAWVSRLKCLPWDGHPDSLLALISTLATQPGLLHQARHEANQRYLSTFSRRVWLNQFHRVFSY